MINPILSQTGNQTVISDPEWMLYSCIYSQCWISEVCMHFLPVLKYVIFLLSFSFLFRWNDISLSDLGSSFDTSFSKYYLGRVRATCRIHLRPTTMLKVATARVKTSCVCQNSLLHNTFLSLEPESNFLLPFFSYSSPPPPFQLPLTLHLRLVLFALPLPLIILYHIFSSLSLSSLPTFLFKGW